MSRTQHLIYVVAFSALLLALSLWSLKGLYGFSPAEGTSVLDGKLAQAVEKHYDAEFPVKRFGTNVWAAVDYTLFGEGRPGVLIGEKGWLYSDEEFKPVADAASHQRDNLALIQGVRDELAKRDIQLVMAIIPAKTRLYPEYAGDNRPTEQYRSLYQQFRGTVRGAGILAPDLLGPLEEAKKQGEVFLRTDTHWTPLGAEVAARELSESVQQAVSLRGTPQRFVTEAVAMQTHKGDLTTFLPMDPLFDELMPAQEQLQQRETRAADDAASGDDALFAEAEIPVALVGTSYSANPKWNFAGALRQSLQRDLSNHAEDGHGPILPMLKYLQSDEIKDNPPQLVIWEFPERYLPMAYDLSGFDPAWIAQLKAGAGNERLVSNLTGKAGTPAR